MNQRKETDQNRVYILTRSTFAGQQRAAAFIQYATGKSADPIKLRIYPGADGSFTLYEDENDNYNYEKGVYSTIDFRWDDAKHQLRISARKGIFPGMLKTRTFHAVLVRKGVGAGVEVTEQPDKMIPYQGEQQAVQLPR